MINEEEIQKNIEEKEKWHKEAWEECKEEMLIFEKAEEEEPDHDLQIKYPVE